jgi:hypothetical protein
MTCDVATLPAGLDVGHLGWPEVLQLAKETTGSGSDESLVLVMDSFLQQPPAGLIPLLTAVAVWCHFAFSHI